MSRLTGENIEKFYSGDGDKKKIAYFSLKDNGDTARIRFLYNGAEDIDGYTVHRVKVGDYERPVNCLLEKDSPIDDCPFCKAKIAKQARVFIPIFNEDTGELQVWERPNTFYGKIAGLCARYPNIVSQVFEVERRGAKGYQKTDYDFYPVGQPDGTTIEDILDDCELDELPEIVGSRFLMSKTADEMEYYVQHGEFPDTRDSAPVRRRDRRAEPSDAEPNDEPVTTRRRSRGNGQNFV